MVPIRYGVLLFSCIHSARPGVLDISSHPNQSLDVALSLALVELVLAATVALACGLALFLAGVITTTDFWRTRSDTQSRGTAIGFSGLDDVPVPVLKTVANLRQRHS